MQGYRLQVTSHKARDEQFILARHAHAAHRRLISAYDDIAIGIQEQSSVDPGTGNESKPLYRTDSTPGDRMSERLRADLVELALRGWIHAEMNFRPA